MAMSCMRMKGARAHRRVPYIPYAVTHMPALSPAKMMISSVTAVPLEMSAGPKELPVTATQIAMHMSTKNTMPSMPAIALASNSGLAGVCLTR